MSEDNYVTRGLRRGSRPRSLCARCGSLQERRSASPGRSGWRDAGKGLSLEINGREGRKRNLSTGGGERPTSQKHCYIVPIGQGVASTTTYRESFQTPPHQISGTRHARSVPSSPVSSSPLWSPVTPNTAPVSSRPNTAPVRPSTQLLVTRLQQVQAAGKPSNTTYRDHYTWLS
ncbi:uncharacterized protein LOC131954562 [Physella acuta]|uniref:uncharacterized protein LOC131954562 n=1 Tax=Physella acuta TaxID=109671 RepID=UPI0027DB3DB0|nr:uncharacterized protein LOC131954562 [Physella acuta]